MSQSALPYPYIPLSERKQPTDTLEALLVNDSFRRWVLSRASREEQASWEEWLASRFENQRMAEEAAQIIYLLQFSHAPSWKGKNIEEKGEKV